MSDLGDDDIDVGAQEAAGGMAIEADTNYLQDYDTDTDSAVSGLGANASASTASLASSIFHSREENGRTYHGYKEGKYVLPDDERELDRQDLQYHLCLLTFNQRLAFAPLGKLDRVLDVGCGTGIWAMDFADEHPEATVLGVDLSPVQPQFVPPNVRFEIDDLEEPWNFNFKFDYIHSMMMTGAFKDWPRFYQQAFDNLESGGYIEIQDIDFPIQCDDASLPATKALHAWSSTLLRAASALGFPLDTCGQASSMMTAVGFEDVVRIPLKWPINRWPKDRRYKEIGMWVQENFTSGLEAMSLALLTRGLGWTSDEVRLFCVDVRRDMVDPGVHAWWPIYVTYGRKP